MAFIDRMIGQDEKIIARAHPHWIYIVQGLLLLIGGLILGLFLDNRIESYPAAAEMDVQDEAIATIIAYMGTSAFTLCALVGIGLFLHHLIFYRSTHIALTSDRLIYKTGMFFVNVHESAIEEIKGEQVHNGFFGRFLDYGFLEVDCRFVKNMHLPAISKPYSFLHDIHKLTKKNALRERIGI
jgi:uncharacterized protein YneF (UPF0154 family)